MKKEFIDIVKVTDSKPRGVVTAYQNGKLLFTKENTIVKDGRNTIFKAFCASVLNSALLGALVQKDIDAINSLPKFDKISIGDGLGVTNSDYSASDFGKISNLPAADDDKTVNVVDKNIDASNTTISLEDRTITFSDISFSSTVGYTARELGIFLSDGSLFSRLAFDPVFVGPGSTFTITYRIYF